MAASPTRHDPPSTVIPLAEQSDLITDIGRWVLGRAWTDRGRWHHHLAAGELALAVNVSAHQLLSPGFASDVASALKAADIAPQLLTLEITESVFVQDSDRAMMVLRDLKELGVLLALDDFGTGYSSLTFLQRFPLDIVKIDGALVADLQQNKASCAIVEAVVNLAHILDMTVVAEGVETAVQHRRVSELGCDACQGFHFGRPMPAAGIERMLERGNRHPHLPTPREAEAGRVAPAGLSSDDPGR